MPSTVILTATAEIPWPAALGIGLLCAVLAWLLVRYLIGYLEARAILDRPNRRSSHIAPTPRGGGIAIVAVAVPALAGILSYQGHSVGFGLILLGAFLILAMVSWLDDLKGLSARLRLTVHLICAAAGIFLLRDALARPEIAPDWLIWTAAGLALVWFLNLYNFMDGIDGIAGVETIAVAGGISLIAYLEARNTLLGPGALAVAGAALGFLVWNWHPARIFMGDVGSVPLGFLLGWMLLFLAAAGEWAAALILPAYYLADASFTLGRRLLRGERFWEAHKEHIYQLAVQRGKSHAQVSGAIGVANLALIVCAFASVRGHLWAGLAAAGIVLILLVAYLVPRGD